MPQLTEIQDSTALAVPPATVVVLGRIDTLGEVDTVSDRLRLSSDCQYWARRYGATISSRQALLARIDEHERAGGGLLPETRAARLRLNDDIARLTHQIGLLMAESHAETDGAVLHQRHVRRLVRVDAYLAHRMLDLAVRGGDEGETTCTQ